MPIEQVDFQLPAFTAESVKGQDLDKTRSALIALGGKLNEIIAAGTGGGSQDVIVANSNMTLEAGKTYISSPSINYTFNAPFSENITDAAGHSVTAFGNAAVSGGKLNLDGTGDYLTVGGNVAQRTNDFVFQFKALAASLSGSHTIYDSRDGGAKNGFVLFVQGGVLYAGLIGTGTTSFIVDSNQFGVGSEISGELKRVGNTFTLSKDGVVIGTHTGSYDFTNQTALIGTNVSGVTGDTNYKWNGSLRDIKLFSGVNPSLSLPAPDSKSIKVHTGESGATIAGVSYPSNKIVEFASNGTEWIVGS